MFKETLAKEHLLTHLFHYSHEYHEDVVKILKLVLKKFHIGFDKQKGAIFGFGSTSNDDTGHILKICSLNDKSILLNTPVHNLGSERSVGMINYELNLRGRENLESSSQNLVLNKSTDLLNNFKIYKKFRKQSRNIEDLKQKWSEKMEVLKQKGLLDKEAMSLAEERKKLSDLQFLKAQNPPGPFTSADEVDAFMKNTMVSEKDKNTRLYTEVRYAKLSTSNMKRSSVVFRLKKNYQRLCSEDYAHNLKLYFGCVTSVSTITRADLSYILTGLNAANTSNETDQSSSQINSESSRGQLKIGSHVAGVWSNEDNCTGNTLTWYLGVVESLSENGAMVAYMVQTNTNSKSNWMYPDASSNANSTFNTPYDQIISTEIPVKYSCATIIRCQLTTNTVNEIDQLLAEYNQNLESVYH